ncbi:hypothetical protein HMPREF9370_1027 [Neisseria wadsworthii 9715]|uniref:Uncharacterized protein n=1 Tax=Neisseria wadsworthii 9715 TaxID=1030841 RepID=G4CPL7_9NEIS|nr:hypothetical protein HMPREF9370_1027 [Neisseria wadsworthii 9715]
MLDVSFFTCPTAVYRVNSLFIYHCILPFKLVSDLAEEIREMNKDIIL